MLVQINTMENPWIEEFLQGVRNRKLLYYASDIQQMLETEGEIQLKNAVQRAMDACRSQGLPLSDHFKSVYRCQEMAVLKDWKLSGLAWCLVLLNYSPSHPAVARMQLTLLNKGLGSRQ